jgi:hypothetical protein
MANFCLGIVHLDQSEIIEILAFQDVLLTMLNTRDTISSPDIQEYLTKPASKDTNCALIGHWNYS